MHGIHIRGMKLADWLKANGKTATWLADQVGRDSSFIVRIKNGDALPSITVAAEIQRLTDGEVTAVDFVAGAPVEPEAAA